MGAGREGLIGRVHAKAAQNSPQYY